MKRIISVLVMAVMLTGCSAPVYETMADVIQVGGQQVQPREIIMSFPEDATLLTSVGEDRLYLCDGYTLTLQTYPAGNISATILALTGKCPDDLTLIERACGDHARRDFVWITNGEEGEMLCRAAVLDDGNYHYSLTVMAAAADAVDLTAIWNELFSAFCLETQEEA